ncbi:hypothetical protein Ddye_008778 [Dipteronia dyeriana]|uniref:Uncharacterized protein n=1 Tax=Dipteronia dyeriana TaxID=168575 RepID=A0AAD9XA46_9ROSI|nr:hypothetical protein Ddye_008778 [Dipteronia dyeriana]
MNLKPISKGEASSGTEEIRWPDLRLSSDQPSSAMEPSPNLVALPHTAAVTAIEALKDWLHTYPLKKEEEGTMTPSSVLLCSTLEDQKSPHRPL